MVCSCSGRNESRILRNISILSLLFYAFPLLLKWDTIELENEPILNIKSSLQSFEFYIALVCSLSMVAPMVLELVVRIILNLNSMHQLEKNMILSNLTMLILLVVPDLTTLFYVIPDVNVSVIGFIIPARVVCISWQALSLIHKYSGTNWSVKWSCIFHAMVCISGMPDAYCVYFNYQNSFQIKLFLEIFQTFMIIMSGIIITILSSRWYIFILSTMKKNILSTDQYLCNIYVTAFILAGFGLFMNYFIHFSEHEWYQFQKSTLINHYIMFAVFYIVIVIFESRCYQRENIRNEVKTYVNCFIHMYHILKYTYNYI